jgi:hypothetical protein
MGHMGYRADAYWEICCSRFRFKGISKWFDAHPDLIPTGGTDLTAARRAIDARRDVLHAGVKRNATRLADAHIGLIATRDRTMSNGVRAPGPQQHISLMSVKPTRINRAAGRRKIRASRWNGKTISRFP